MENKITKNTRQLCVKEFKSQGELDDFIQTNTVDVDRKEIRIEANRSIYILKYWLD